MAKRTCPECKEPITGRADKKFCSDYCRNAFNNRINSDSFNSVRRINRILKKNRHILSEINTDGKTKTTRTRLLEHGFNFSYHTHTYSTAKGSTYIFNYEQGYLALEKDYYLLVLDKKESDHEPS